MLLANVTRFVANRARYDMLRSTTAAQHTWRFTGNIADMHYYCLTLSLQISPSDIICDHERPIERQEQLQRLFYSDTKNVITMVAAA